MTQESTRLQEVREAAEFLAQLHENFGIVILPKLFHWHLKLFKFNLIQNRIQHRFSNLLFYFLAFTY